MTNDTRTADDIEQDISDERAQMADTFNDLQKKFSVDAIVTDLGGMLRGQGGEIGRSIAETVGRNPAAVVLVGVGLAWLFLGQTGKQGTQSEGRQSASRPMRRQARPGPDAGFPEEEAYWYGNGQMSVDGRAPFRAAQPRGARAGDACQGTNGVTGTIRHAADSLGDTAGDMTDRLSYGLESLSDEARVRVLAARRAAQEARVTAQAALGRATHTASGLFDDHPLVAGALAVALGAAFGGALPHSKIEDDVLGNSSNLLFAEAQALFQAERKKAVSALKGAATDAQGEIREMGADLADLLPDGKSVGQVIVERTSDAAARVLDRAAEAVLPENPNTPRT